MRAREVQTSFASFPATRGNHAGADEGAVIRVDGRHAKGRKSMVLVSGHSSTTSR